jgi:RNA polymerase sigma factor (sigma-70 family)
MNPLTTSFVARLRDRDETAWFELWEVFGPVLRAQLHRWGKGAIGAETVRDLSQETLAALSDSIGRFDPNRGARFSTWLLAIARHTLGDEIDRRMALKRGAGKRPQSLDESFMGRSRTMDADEAFERAVFQAKVLAAIRAAEKETEFVSFQVYQMRVFDGRSGRNVAEQLGVSEPTVSRHLARTRAVLRERLAEVVATYSFTDDEHEELGLSGLGHDDALFDEALSDIFSMPSSRFFPEEAP